MLVRRLFRMRCTWDFPSSASTVPGRGHFQVRSAKASRPSVGREQQRVSWRRMKGRGCRSAPGYLENTVEHGATRNLRAEKVLEEEEKTMQKEREKEERNNPWRKKSPGRCGGRQGPARSPSKPG
ncbi:uncharacterized protein WM294_014523 [Sarcoramphus papa]